MRELKFRGKCVNTGRWVYGHYFITPLSDENTGARVEDGLFFLTGRRRHCIANQNGCVYEVDPLTVGQSTGLHDKNGKEIYEGDIISIPDDWDEFGWMAGETREVYFCDASFRLKPKKSHASGRGHLIEDCMEVCEVIGNVHEHAHLLPDSTKGV